MSVKVSNMKKMTLLIILVLFCGYLHAQETFSNSGNLQVHAGGSLSAFGNTTNTVTGNLINNGSLYLRADLINDQTSMSVGTGTLYLNGNAIQSVSGSQAFRTFNLVTNNSAGITLNNNLSISGAHTFTAGIIITSATPNYLVYEAGSSYSGDGDALHVNGWVKKLGNTNFSFPVGNGTVIRKAAIESLSGTLEFNARYQAPNPTYLSVLMPLVVSDRYEFWNINRVSASGSALVHLNWDNSKVVFPPYVLNAIRVANYAGGLWTDRGGAASGDINTTGDVTSISTSAFGNFTFGSLEFMIPLQFLGITAHQKSGYKLVEWKTADATNTDHFQVERSEDALHFQQIGTVKSHNSPVVMSYSFKDFQASNGTVWYRVKSIDADGQYKLSAVVSLKDIMHGNQQMYVLNNPAQGSVHLYAPESYQGDCDYYLTTTAGQMIQKGQLTVTGAGNLSINLNSGISPGVYLLQVKNATQQFQERIFVK